MLKSVMITFLNLVTALHLIKKQPQKSKKEGNVGGRDLTQINKKNSTFKIEYLAHHVQRRYLFGLLSGVRYFLQ